MNNQDQKKTWVVFTKLVLWSTLAVNTNSSRFSSNFYFNKIMIIGSTKEDLTLEKRVAITPDSAKNIINLGLKVIIEKNYASHLGINDDEFKKHGVQILETSKEILSKNNLLLKVNCPNEDEIKISKQIQFL